MLPSPLIQCLLNDWQRDFPLLPEPFAELATQLGCRAETVLAHLQTLQASGVISRVGPVVAPRCIGASTLAALAIAPAQLASVAAAVSAYPQVNHNYAREHRYNLWFVASARNEAELDQFLQGLSLAYATAETPLLKLPLVNEFHIDLGFHLSPSNAPTPHPTLHPTPQQSSPTARRRLHGSRGASVQFCPSLAEWELLDALQQGLPLVHRPFAQLGQAIGWDEATVLATLQHWTAAKIIKRFGLILRHQELGYRANAMVVFNVPDAEVAAIGQRLAEEPEVTLCYQRQRQLPTWSYNLYCMVHGHTRAEVLPVVARLSALAGQTGLPLFSVQRFKQCGARYAPLAA